MSPVLVYPNIFVISLRTIKTNDMNTEKLIVTIQDSGNQTETFEASVIGGESFSAKVLRKALQKHVTNLVTLDVKHSVSRGRSLTISATFKGVTTALKPVYFGGYTGNKDRKAKVDKSLKEQFAALVVDIKELAQ